MKIVPFAPSCGGLVKNIQLSDLSDDDIETLREAFASFGVLFFRDQVLPPEEHLRFAERFGTIVINKFFAPVDGHNGIAEVRKEKDQITNIGAGWHTDHSYDVEPAMGSILVARALPSTGGDTRFANLAAAYDGLTDAMKLKLSKLRAVHANDHIYGKDGYYAKTDLAPLLQNIGDTGKATHPVIVRHPESGRKILYVNPAHTVGFEGQSYEESLPLLTELYDHVDQPEYTCQFDWKPGSVALWDNRSTWHFANNDYDGEKRLMHRITLAGSSLAAA